MFWINSWRAPARGAEPRMALVSMTSSCGAVWRIVLTAPPSPPGTTVRQHSWVMFVLPQSFAVCLQHSVSGSVIASGMKQASCGPRAQTIATLNTSARLDHDISKVYMSAGIRRFLLEGSDSRRNGGYGHSRVAAKQP